MANTAGEITRLNNEIEEFKALLNVENISPSKETYLQECIVQRMKQVTGLTELMKLQQSSSTSGANRKRVAIGDWFPDNYENKRIKIVDYKVVDPTETNYDANSGTSQDDNDDVSEIKFITMKDLPPIVNKNNRYKIIYIREDYETISLKIFDTIKLSVHNQMHDNFNIMVTGNPGIGKSYFYLYIIFILLADASLLHDKILVINSDNNFFKYSEEDKCFESVDPSSVKYESNVLRLIDGKTSDSELTSWAGSNILFASPSDEVNNKPSNFMKNFETNYYYMAVWSESELLIANSLLPDRLRQKEDDLLDKIIIAGPIPRSVLMKDKTLEDLKKTIKGAVSSISNAIDIVDYVHERKSVKEAHYSHTLLKMTPTSCGGTYFDFTVSFLSAHVADLVIDACVPEGRKELKKFACENDDPESAKFRGNIYEHFIHSLIMTLFCSREVRALSVSYSSFKLPALPLNLEARRFRRLENITLKKNDSYPTYFIPVIPNLGAYDSIFWDGRSTCYLIQITIAEEHTIKNEPVRLFLEWSMSMNLTIKFVFIVPKKVYQSWTMCQKLVGVNNKTLTSSRQVTGLQQFVLQMDIMEQ